MTSWLIETQASKITTAPPVAIVSSSSNTATVVVLAVLLGFMILITAGLLWLRCRRKAKGFLARSEAGQGFLGEALFRRRNPAPVEVAEDDSYERDMHAVTIGPAAKSLKIEAFEHDPFLYTKRLSFGGIVVTRLISKGAYGEVWLGQYRHKEVAIKKILHAKRNDTFELECFTEEIRIMASLDHPHIVHLIGFGWDTITNLCAVTEYLAKGDLTGYLVANQDLSWDAKLRIAVGTARALAYMHERDPPVIHRDLKSKNILITDTGEAKLSDFGISRVRTLDETLTAGVGTVYWTAPEVLLGQRYTEQVDIYSFGVVLCELDTHRAPYADMQEVAQMAIAQQVATHQFRPPFSAKCPKLVKDLADRCMDQDPSARPTAQEIVDLIELWKGWKKDSFQGKVAITGIIVKKDGEGAPLRPRFTKDSPEWFREVANAWMDGNPSLRPSISSDVSLDKFQLTLVSNMPSRWLENADYVNRFRELEKNKVVSDALVPSTAPSNVLDRLNSSSLKWSDLTQLAKQAILWDMGYVRTSADPENITQVYTACSSSGKGASMASIVVSKELFLASQTNASTISCTGADGNYSRQENSHGLYLGKVVKCAVGLLPEVSTPNSYASMWGQDGLGNNVVPDPRFWRHEWHSQGFPSFFLFAIHTVPASAEETAWGKCPSKDQPGSLIIPCTLYNFPVNMSYEVSSPDGVTWCVPQQSSAMSDWLSDIQDAKTGRKISTTTIVLISVIGVLLIVVFLIFYLRWRKRHNGGSSSDGSNYNRMTASGQTSGAGTALQTLTKQTIQTASPLLNAFQEDPLLCSKRLPYSSITCIKMISKGAFGEVWIGTLDEHTELVKSPHTKNPQTKRTVAIKKILDSKRSDAHELECFADEIRLMALFSHPNIVTFIGFAWNTLQNMSCVTEYLVNGDLSEYLAAHKNLDWKTKLHLGHGLLKAILYLHQRSPPVIHRDLKGRNVLIGDDVTAKLSDFGISRQRIADETMTMGVGTAFWTAPEVLLGLKYDSSVDIYSFGCIMSELDTHATPYSDMKGVPSMQIVHRITGQDSGSVPLRPRFNDNSPEWYREVASACLHQDASLRPTIVDLELRFAQELAKLE
ncbi:kinase [Thraustotheca clavata]|uniref:Kinase n=1 Tax=Thraustotheca clavata TaxID=74557 RepID=A0A1W0A407_9STRA|nr:kinase [Thraustotheca clavata]